MTEPVTQVVNILACRPADDEWSRFADRRLLEYSASIVDCPEVELGGLRDHLARDPEQTPHVVGLQHWRPQAIVPTTERVGTKRIAAGYTVRGWTTMLLLMPHAGVVLVLSATIAGTLEHWIQCLNDCYYRRALLRVEGDDRHGGLLAGLVATLEPRVADSMGTLVLDQDAHQMLLFDDLAALARPGRDEVDRQLLGAILYRGEPFRDTVAAPRLPVDANRSLGTLVAIEESITVIAGHARHMVNGMLVSAAQLVCALARARQIRRQVFLELRTLRLLEDDHAATLHQRKEAVIRASVRFGDLETDLNFGAQASLDLGEILPVAQIAGYHHELIEVTRLDRHVTRATHFLDLLARSIGAVREATNELARERADRFSRNLAVIASIVVVPSLVAAFYGANVKGLPKADEDNGATWLLGLMLAFTAVVALAVWLLWNRQVRSRTGRHRRASR